MSYLDSTGNDAAYKRINSEAILEKIKGLAISYC